MHRTEFGLSVKVIAVDKKEYVTKQGMHGTKENTLRNYKTAALPNNIFKIPCTIV